MKRSGQHLIIDWICRGLQEVVHLNHCRFSRVGLTFELLPSTGRLVVYAGGDIDDPGPQGLENIPSRLNRGPFPNLFYSIENVALSHPMIVKLDRSYEARTLLILRDPPNWLASTLKRRDWTLEEVLEAREIFVEYLRQATSRSHHVQGECRAINFNEFVSNVRYRRRLAASIGLAHFDRAEVALSHVPDFGGGSSFEQQTDKPDVLGRWKDFAKDETFRDVLSDRRLIELAVEFFGPFPGLFELGLDSIP